MAIEGILARIEASGLKEKEAILAAGRAQADRILAKARTEAEGIATSIIAREQAAALKKKQGFIVNARLAAKNDLLAAKQEVIDQVFDKLKDSLGKGRFKKQLISQDKVAEVAEEPAQYLYDVRHEFETEIAKILFE